MEEVVGVTGDQDKESLEMSSLTLNDIYVELTQRVSMFNARLMLDSSIQKSGVPNEEGAFLNKGEVKTICMELIRNGGPSFQVGKNIYNRMR